MEEYGLMDLITLVTAAEPSRDLSFTLTVVIAGLGIVLSTLAVLIVVFYAFGAIVSKTQKKANSKKSDDIQISVKKAATPVAKNTVKKDEQGLNGEVVAAISAAVYVMEGENAQITSITPVAPVVKRKQNPIGIRNPWAQAAVVDNTRSF